MRKVYYFASADGGLLDAIPEQDAVVRKIFRQYLSEIVREVFPDFHFKSNLPSFTEELMDNDQSCLSE